MKKVILILAVVAAAAAAGFFVLARQAPALFVSILEKELGKKVTLEGIRYQFPSGLHVRRLAVIEKGAFEGESSLYVENVDLAINLPALLNREIQITQIQIDNPQIIIRKTGGRISHAFTPSETARPASAAPADAPQSPSKPAEPVAFSIGHLVIKNGIVRWIDYDVVREGFAVQIQEIQADIKDFTLKIRNQRTTYDFEAAVVQGRDRHPARIEAKGWTNALNADTDAAMVVQGLWLPYFAPYYQQVTPATLQDGTLDLKATALVLNRDLEVNAHAEISNPVFTSFEPDGGLFGIDAPSILGLLKNRSGRVPLDIVVRWNMADASMTFERVLRKSIADSLRATFFNNIQNVVENTLEKYSQDPDGFKKDWKSLINKIEKIAD